MPAACCGASFKEKAITGDLPPFLIAVHPLRMLLSLLAFSTETIWENHPPARLTYARDFFYVLIFP
jgi:hypothetical protein